MIKKEKTVSTTTLHYRNYQVTGGGDDSSNNNNIRSSSKISKNKNQSRDYNNPHHHQHDHHISSFFHTLWTAGKTRRAKEQHELQKRKEQEQKQYVLDDYLESIDRRYKRLHEETKNTNASASTKGTLSLSSPSSSSSSTNNHGNGFTSALQWLTQGESSSFSSTSKAEEVRKQEDAIYVLGLAELASEKLLQRHQLPIPKRNKSVVIDIDVVDHLPSTVATATSPTKNKDLFQKDGRSSTNASVGSSTTTTTDTMKSPHGTARSVTLPNKQIPIFQLVRNLRSSRKNLKTILPKVAICSLLIPGCTQILKFLGKHPSQAMRSFLSFIGSTSGSKQSLQVFSVMIVSFLTLASSFVRRSITKA